MYRSTKLLFSSLLIYFDLTTSSNNTRIICYNDIKTHTDTDKIENHLEKKNRVYHLRLVNTICVQLCVRQLYLFHILIFYLILAMELVLR